MFMIVPPLCMRGTAYLIPKKGPRSSKAIDRSKPSTDIWAIGSPSSPAPCVVHNAIEPAETIHCKIHERFGVGRAPSVCPVKRYVVAEFFF
jgi:hypothetical protein